MAVPITYCLYMLPCLIQVREGQAEVLSIAVEC